MITFTDCFFGGLLQFFAYLVPLIIITRLVIVAIEEITKN